MGEYHAITVISTIEESLDESCVISILSQQKGVTNVRKNGPQLGHYLVESQVSARIEVPESIPSSAKELPMAISWTPRSGDKEGFGISLSIWRLEQGEKELHQFIVESIKKSHGAVLKGCTAAGPVEFQLEIKPSHMKKYL